MTIRPRNVSLAELRAAPGAPLAPPSSARAWAKWASSPGTLTLLSAHKGKASPFSHLSLHTGQKQMFTPAEESQTFLQLTTLCQDRTLVGMKLLDKISSVPHGELSCSKFLAIFLRVLGPRSPRTLLALAFPKLCLDPCSCPGSLPLQHGL